MHLTASETKSSQRSFLLKASFLVMLGTLGSRLLGFFREVVIAAYFGNGIAADAYQVAYIIPNLLLQLFGCSAIGSAFIPIITKYLAEKDYENLNIVASSVANFLILFFTFFIFIGLIFAPQITKLIAPGFTTDLSKLDLTIKMARIMIPNILFLGMAGFVMGMLHAYNHFNAPAFAPILFNIIEIASIIILTQYLGPLSMAIGVALGALFQLIIQIPFLKGRDWKYSFRLDWDHPGVRQVATLIIPVVFTLASIELNVFVDTHFASMLKTGSVAALHYAIRIWSLPTGIFAITISTVLFPMFSRKAVRNDQTGLKEAFSLGLRMVFLMMVPASVFLIVLAQPIIRLLFQRGAFGANATRDTAIALVFYAIGLVSSGALYLVNRMFYSLQDTLTPTKVTVIAITVNFFGDWILMKPLGHGGIALSTSLVMTFNFLCLLVILRKKIGQMGGRKIVLTFIKVLAASCMLGVGAFWGWNYADSLVSKSLGGQFISVVAGLTAGISAYLITAIILKTEELSIFSNLISSKFAHKNFKKSH